MREVPYISFYFDNRGYTCFRTNSLSNGYISELVSANEAYRFHNEIYCINCEECDGLGFHIDKIDEYNGLIYGFKCKKCKGRGRMTITEFFFGFDKK